MQAVEQPAVLILSSRYDFSCDQVAIRLSRKGVPFLRLNSEDLPTIALEMDPVARTLSGECGEMSFHLSDHSLQAIYFRRPVFQRQSGDVLSPDDQLNRSQWAAFTRSFMVFEHARWMNHPAATYRAETKPVQLAAAVTVGFEVPPTLVTNTAASVEHVRGSTLSVVAKSLDTILIRHASQQFFSYSQVVPIDVLDGASLASSPIILQRFLDAKLDLRVTVVDGAVFCVSITCAGRSIDGDWRLAKREAVFLPYELPTAVSERCITLVRNLGLSFGAIDLALRAGEYYFLEINPTGEWAWLTEQAAQPIDNAIADFLARGVS